MFSKIFSFILVYILSVANFLVILTPMMFVLLGENLLNSYGNYTKSLIFLSISATSFLMLLFLLFDFCFSSSVRFYKKRSIKYDKNNNYKIFERIFDNIKKKFNKKNVQLYISNSNEVNAFAVGSLRQNIIVLTTGLIDSYSSRIKNNNQFLLSIEGIIGHEMSHIINKDYFTALLLIVNERAVNFISKIIFIFFNFLIRIINLIPLIGNYISNIILILYKILNFLISFFYKKIMINIYKFIQLQISKNIEYRADKQGAKAIGGKNMAYTLSLLGESGYFTIFSSHPATKNRVEKVKNIELSEKKISSVFISNIIFLLSFILIIYIIYYTFKLAKVDLLIQDFNNMKMFFVNKYILLKSHIIMFLNK